MTTAYNFDKRSIIYLLIIMFFLLILVFFFGLLLGMNIQPAGDQPSQQAEVTRSDEEKAEEIQIEEGAKPDSSKKVSLARETVSKPASPKFSEVAPTSEAPKISPPKN